MAWGGARDGSGRKKKYEESETESRPVRIPNEISDQEVEQFVKEKLKEKKNG